MRGNFLKTGLMLLSCVLLTACYVYPAQYYNGQGADPDNGYYPPNPNNYPPNYPVYPYPYRPNGYIPGGGRIHVNPVQPSYPNVTPITPVPTPRPMPMPLPPPSPNGFIPGGKPQVGPNVTPITPVKPMPSGENGKDKHRPNILGVKE